MITFRTMHVSADSYPPDQQYHRPPTSGILQLSTHAPGTTPIGTSIIDNKKQCGQARTAGSRQRPHSSVTNTSADAPVIRIPTVLNHLSISLHGPPALIPRASARGLSLSARARQQLSARRQKKQIIEISNETIGGTDDSVPPVLCHSHLKIFTLHAVHISRHHIA